MSEAFDPYRKWLGIPPKDQPPDHYRLLGIERFEDDPDAIANAADRQMAHVRTFQAGPHSAASQQILNELATARVTLLNRERKAQYDGALRSAIAALAVVHQTAVHQTPQVVPPVAAIPLSAAPVAIQAPGVDPIFSSDASPTFASRSGASSASRYARPRSSPWLGSIAAGVVLLAITAAVLMSLNNKGDDQQGSGKQPPARGSVSEADIDQGGPSSENVGQQASRTLPGGVNSSSQRSGSNVPARSPWPTSARQGTGRTDPRVASNVAPPKGNQAGNTSVGAVPVPRGAQRVVPTQGTSIAPSVPTTARPRPEAANPTASLAGLVGTKMPPLTPDELAAAQPKVLELYNQRIESAKTPQAKSEIARVLLQQGRGAASDPRSRYVLLERASSLAAAAGDAQSVIEAIDELDRQHQIDALQLKAKALEAASKVLVPEGRQALSDAALAVADELVERDDYPSAAEMHKVATAAARAMRDNARLKDVGERRREAERLAKAFTAIKELSVRLAADPNDAEANLAVGKFRAWVKDDWTSGLDCLARGSDATLKALAQSDLANPSDIASRKQLGDGWWELSQKERGAAKKALRGRAGYWYRQAVSQLKDADLESVKRRLSQIEGSDDEATKFQYLADMSEQGVRVDRNWFAKGRSAISNRPIKFNGTESSKGLFMHPARNDHASAGFQVDKRAKLFLCGVGIDDGAGGNPATPLVFEVWGDGVLIARLGPIASKGQYDQCEIKVGKFRYLELRVVCSGRNNWAHAVWLEPRLVLK